MFPSSERRHPTTDNICYKTFTRTSHSNRILPLSRWVSRTFYLARKVSSLAMMSWVSSQHVPKLTPQLIFFSSLQVCPGEAVCYPCRRTSPPETLLDSLLSSQQNVTSSSTVVATLEAARDKNSPIILQASQGGAAFFAGKVRGVTYKTTLRPDRCAGRQE